MPKITNPNSCFRRVRFTRAEVEAFKDKWPCNGLNSKAYWFEFDTSYDLVDTNCASDTGAAAALCQDAQDWLYKQDA